MEVVMVSAQNRNGRSALKTGARDRFRRTMAETHGVHFIFTCTGDNVLRSMFYVKRLSPVAAAAFVPSSATSILTSWKASDT
ncbi:hypothetical protein EYF80_053810 [Liparis tanakae]|uniref:Uncharacterized protein n=1 Tax=Liparis tanakae TaxID=230148 RepID=A0A4Z2F459_9TELE|nr:hypothetical protein EYF80_053810 [Liparis tanakae]